MHFEFILAKSTDICEANSIAFEKEETAEKHGKRKRKEKHFEDYIAEGVPLEKNVPRKMKNPVYGLGASIALVDLVILEEIGQLTDPELSAQAWGMKSAPHCLLVVCPQHAVIHHLVAHLVAGGHGIQVFLIRGVRTISRFWLFHDTLGLRTPCSDGPPPGLHLPEWSVASANAQTVWVPGLPVAC
ncbi:UNVERIFIED_CONTAM: hypothetical protein K2H54_043061 [Gekko kuhli]